MKKTTTTSAAKTQVIKGKKLSAKGPTPPMCSGFVT
jgi:hypothetical protein